MTARTGRPATEIVAAALAEVPATTTASELAQRTGLGASTVTKALGSMEAAGAATRQPGGRFGGRRQPDRWSPVPQRPASASAEKKTGGAAAKPRNAVAARGAARLGSGDLRALVLDQLHAADEPAGPSMLAGRLGRSAGAVGNALERLVALGQAALVSEHPRRYRAVRRR